MDRAFTQELMEKTGFPAEAVCGKIGEAEGRSGDGAD